MARLTAAIKNLSLLGNFFKPIPVVGERLEGATAEGSQICVLVQEIREHKEVYESLALRVAQLLAAIAVVFKKLGPEPSQSTMEVNVDHLRGVLSEVSSIVKDRASHQHERRRALDILFQHNFNPLCRLYHDNADISRLHRRVDEVVERFKIAPLMRTGGVLALAGINVGLIAQNLKLEDREDNHVDADNALLLTLAPSHLARWDVLDLNICLEQELTAVLTTLCSWAASSSSESIFWLGAEDGAISSTLARRFCQVANIHTLGASFFVDYQAQPPHEPTNVIHSIAYQLAVHDVGFSRAVCASLRKCPDLLSRPLQEQCTRLIAEPAATMQAESPLLIVIDAFEMCAQDPQARGGEGLVRLLFDMVSQARTKFRLLITCHLSEATRRLLDELNTSQHRSLFRAHIWTPVPHFPTPDRPRIFNPRKTLRAAVLAIIAIERMSILLDYRAWLSQDAAPEQEHPPDASHTPLWSAEGLRGRDIMISLPAHECVLSKHLIQRLEDLMCDGVGVQTAVDILDRALLDSDPSNSAYGQSVRRLRRWCRKYSLLPTSFKPISVHAIQLESDQPRYITPFSDVFYGDHDGTKVAVKVLRVYTSGTSLDDDQKSFRNEVVTWRYLRHRNIVPFLGVCDKSPLCLVSHWMEEGTLFDFFVRHPDECRTSYILGTARGLAFMHSLGVVHGDIKAINILVDREHRARLADFGLASVLNNSTTAITNVSGGGAKGTVRYMAPELYLASDVRTDRSDIYAFSITIWEAFTLKLALSHIRDTTGLIVRVGRGERPTKPVGCENIGFTDDLWRMMQLGWATKPESRPSLSAFIELLEAQG